MQLIHRYLNENPSGRYHHNFIFIGDCFDAHKASCLFCYSVALGSETASLLMSELAECGPLSHTVLRNNQE